MSGQATGWALKFGPRPEHVDRHGVVYGQRARGLRAVLVTVADAANRDGEHAHPGIKAVCDGALYGRRQAGILLAELVAEGWLAVEHEGGGAGIATVYRMPRMAEENSAVSAQKPSPEPRTLEEEPRTLDPKTAQSEGKTAQSRPRTNGLPTDDHNGLATVCADAVAEPAVNAGQIIKGFIDWCDGNGHARPANPGQLGKAVSQLLAANHPPPAIKRALTTTSAFTLNALEFELRKHEGVTASPTKAKEQRTLAAIDRSAAAAKRNGFFTEDQPNQLEVQTRER